MKNIFKLKSLLFVVIIMAFFTTNVVLGDVNRKSTSKGYGRKNKPNRKKKKVSGKRNKKNFSRKSIVAASQITEAVIAEAIEKSVMPVEPSVIFEEGKEYIDKFDASEEKIDNSIKVGDYYLEIPEGITPEVAKHIVKDKLSLLLSMVMSAACNEQFNLGAIALVLNEDSDYNEDQVSNQNKIKEAIGNSNFYYLSESPDTKEFIKSAIMLELKTLLYPKEKESYFSSWFRGKSVKAQIKEFVKNNNILNKVEALKNIRKESGLDEEVMYLVTAMSYYIKNNKNSFLNSPLFQDIVHAVTIPLNVKLAKIDEAGKINHLAHKEMRVIYKKMLQLYDINKISGIKESENAQFIVQSTSAYVLTKVLQGAGVLGVGALLAGGASAAKNLYYREEADKDKSAWDVIKEGGKKDLATVREGIASGVNYVNDKVAKGYDKAADLLETKVLRREKGRIALREEKEAKNATFLGEIGKYSAKQWDELAKKYDSLTDAEKEKVKIAISLGLTAIPVGGAAVLGGVAKAAAGKSKAVFNSLKTKGSDAVSKIKANFGPKQSTGAAATAQTALVVQAAEAEGLAIAKAI
jgi:hypothetical protein